MGTKPEFEIALAEEIFGWETHEELLWLAEQASRHYLIAELGSFIGRSTRALADNTKGIVWAIDCWERMDYMPALTNDPWVAFNLNLADHLASARVRTIRMRHEQIHPFALPQLNKLDMCYIDGDHSVEAVRRDIVEWRLRLAPGGLLCGHDARSTDWPGVDQAVQELVPDAIYVEGTALWYKEV